MVQHLLRNKKYIVKKEGKLYLLKESKDPEILGEKRLENKPDAKGCTEIMNWFSFKDNPGFK